MRIFLARHGQSEAQVNDSILRTVDDAQVNLTALGHAQAEESAVAMAQLLGATPGKTELYISPYARTQQSGQHYIDRLGHKKDSGLLDRVALNDALTERRKGIAAGLNNDELRAAHPALAQAFEEAWQRKEFHNVTVPGGENYSQLETRQAPMLEVIADAEARGVDNLIIAGHNVANRLLVKQLLKKDYPAFYASEPAMGNADIRALEKVDGQWVDRGYVHRSTPAPCAVVPDAEKLTAAGASSDDYSPATAAKQGRIEQIIQTRLLGNKATSPDTVRNADGTFSFFKG